MLINNMLFDTRTETRPHMSILYNYETILCYYTVVIVHHLLDMCYLVFTDCLKILIFVSDFYQTAENAIKRKVPYSPVQ